jgi:hypothetical protein
MVRPPSNLFPGAGIARCLNFTPELRGVVAARVPSLLEIGQIWVENTHL